MENLKKIKTIVLGIGNILLGDEGIGVHIVKRLQEEDLLPGVLVIDGSTAGFRLLPLFETYRNCKFIIIDAIKLSGISPDNVTYSTADIKNKKNISTRGDLYLIPLNDLYNIVDSRYHNSDFISFHQTGLIDVLKLFSLTHNMKIDGYLIGVNISENSKLDNASPFTVELSNTIEKKIPKIIGLIKKNIKLLAD